MGKIKRWVEEGRYNSRDLFTLVLFLLCIGLLVWLVSDISNKYDNLAKEYVAELEAQKDLRGQNIFQYYYKLSPAMRAYLYDLQNYKSSARVQYIRHFGWENRDVLIGIEHNVVNDTYYGIWGINGSPDYNLEGYLNQDVFIYIE